MMLSNNKYGAQVAGTGSYLPPKVLTNFDLEKMVDTSDQWIQERTGIRERRIVENDVSTSMLAVNASKEAIKDAGINVKEIDLVIVATITPDMFFPSTACLVQKELGIGNCACFDIMAACSGFIYAIACATSMIEAGICKTALVIGAETLSKITNWKDRSTCVLFGDGAGAMILKRTEKENRVLSVYMAADGRYRDILQVPAGGSLHPASLDTVKQNLHYLHMEGKEVFKLAVMKMLEAINKALEMSNKKVEEIALFIPHQANMRIINAIIERLKVPKEKVFVNLDKYGNMSAATTIVALDEARKSGIVKSGDLVELAAFGGGLTWAGSVIKL